MFVGKLTNEQKNTINGQQYAPDCFFNPIQDYYNNWIISTQEMENCTNKEFIFVKQLPLIEYIPKND